MTFYTWNGNCSECRRYFDNAYVFWSEPLNKHKVCCADCWLKLCEVYRDNPEQGFEVWISQ
jgi:hypothetical protein